MKQRPFILFFALLSGCFYPPQQKPPTPNRSSVTLDVPYDLAWDAVGKVVAHNSYRVITSNPNSGVVEAQEVGAFTLDDADCGELRGIAGKIKAEPDPDSSAVYDFHVEAKDEHTSVVSVTATFSAPLHVPLRPIADVQCVSRGVQEARLLNEIRRQGLLEHREPTHADIRKNAP